MKVHYFNDRRVSMVVRVQKFGGLTEEYEHAPHTGAEYDVWIPRGHNLLIKEWDYSLVMIMSIPKKDIDKDRS